MIYVFYCLSAVVSIAGFYLAWRMTDFGWADRELMDWVCFIFFGAAFAVCGTFLVFLPDTIFQQKTEVVYLPVIDRVFAPAQSGTGVGYGYSGSSGGGPVVVSTYEPEKWQVIVDSGGEPVALDSTKRAWHNAVPGRTATVQRWRGAIWGFRMSSTVQEVK